MTYDVMIVATVRKTIRVDAKNEDEAINMAHELFTVASEDGIDEAYDQETVDCELVTE